MSQAVTVAELVLHHSRPIAPTRRLAITECLLSFDPPPGPGGVLLAGVAARYGDAVPGDAREDLGQVVART